MSRARAAIFPIFEEVGPVLASLTDAQFGAAVRFALADYFGNQEQEEATDPVVKLASAVLMSQVARYDQFREKQRTNAKKQEDTAGAAKCGQSTPRSESAGETPPSDPPSPSPYHSDTPVSAGAESGDGCFGKAQTEACREAVRLLNDLTGSSYRDSSQSTRRLVAARLREGYTQDDFEAVIRHQCDLWGQDERMRRYLRPETLFGTKFEAYLMEAKREPQREEIILAPLDDPWEVAMRGEAAYADWP